MKHNRLGIFTAAGLMAGGVLLAQTKSTEVTNEKTTTTPSSTTRTKSTTIVGKVTKFEAGKTVQVSTPKGHRRSFSLNSKNETVNGADNLKPGEMVKITQTTENGKKNVTIAPYTSASHKRR